MNAPPSYSFLSNPPPQKQRPQCPPPPPPARKRSSTFSAIAAWAAHVQPGSPGSPRRASLSHRPPRSRSSFLITDTPDPDHKEFTINLTSLGYTSVFVHLEKPMATKTLTPVNPDTFPIPPSRSRPGPLKRLRSLSILRSRNQSTTTIVPPSPSPTPSESPKITAASVATRKKAVYAYLKSSSSSKPKTQPRSNLPPSLAAELALMQFADGGSTEANVKRVMEARARAAAPAGTKPNNVMPVADVYRDEKGGIWWDREEEMEYVHLLGGHDASRVSGPEKWVSFGGEIKEGKPEEEEERGLAIASLATDAYGRRASANSIVSAMSSLDPCNIIQPAEDDEKLVRVPFVPLSETKRRSTPEPILTIPSRRRHTQHHLRASPNFFLLDLNAFSVPRTPRTPSSPSPSPAPTLTCAQKRRRRPAPLNIVAHVPVRGVSPDHGHDDDDEARRDFLEASFKPHPASYEDQGKVEMTPIKMHREEVYRVPGVAQGSPRLLKKKASRHLLSFFGRK